MTRKRKPQIIVEEGVPTAVILAIEEYRELLERLEDLEDLRALEALRQRPLEFRTLDEFLAGYRPSV